MLGLNPCTDERIFFFCKTSRTDVGATQPPMEPVMTVLSVGKVDSLLSRMSVAVFLFSSAGWRGTLHIFGAYCCNLYRCMEMC